MVSIPTGVLFGMLFGGLVGIVVCVAFASFVKRYNLGRFWNAIVGIAAGGGAAVYAVLFGGALPIVLALIVGLPLVVMVAVGAFLNARAR